MVPIQRTLHIQLAGSSPGKIHAPLVIPAKLLIHPLFIIIIITITFPFFDNSLLQLLFHNFLADPNLLSIR